MRDVRPQGLELSLGIVDVVRPDRGPDEQRAGARDHERLDLDDPTPRLAVLAEWRAAERDAAVGSDVAASGATGLKELYRHSVEQKARKAAGS